MPTGQIYPVVLGNIEEYTQRPMDRRTDQVVDLKVTHLLLGSIDIKNVLNSHNTSFWYNDKIILLLEQLVKFAQECRSITVFVSMFQIIHTILNSTSRTTLELQIAVLTACLSG